MSVGVSDFRKKVWSETVTIFHRTVSAGADGKTATAWTRFVISGCFYGWQRKRRIEGLEIVPSDSRIVRIPAENVPAGFALEPGDVIVRGNVDDVLAVNDSPVVLTRKYGDEAFIADRVTDNTKFERTAHYYASEGA